MKKFILFICITFLLSLLATDPAQAACSFNLSGDQPFSASCGLDANTIDGLDDAGGSDSSTTNTAVLTLSSGTITIPSGASASSTTTLVVGSLALSGGDIAIGITNAQILLNAPKYCIDTDSDGYTSQLTFYTATDSGRRRCSLMHDLANADCDDADPNTASGTLNTYYQDLDSDTYGNSSVSESACSPSAGYVTNNTDCYDANPATTNAELAYPSSATCLGTDRGDTSFDYNCSSSETKCGTIHDKSCTATTCTAPTYSCGGMVPDKYCLAKVRCLYNTTASFACGETGCTGTLFSQGRTSCNSDGTICSYGYGGAEDGFGSFITSTQTCQ